MQNRSPILILFSDIDCDTSDAKPIDGKEDTLMTSKSLAETELEFSGSRKSADTAVEVKVKDSYGKRPNLQYSPQISHLAVT